MTKQIYKIRVVNVGLRPGDQTKVIEVYMMKKSHSNNKITKGTDAYPVWTSSHYAETKLGLTMIDEEFERVARIIEYANYMGFETIIELRQLLD